MFKDIIEIINFAKSNPKNGDKSSTIGKIQTAIANAGLYSRSAIDSTYGPNTKRAIDDYIEAYELTKTGKITTILDSENLDFRTTNDLGKVPLRPGNGSRYSMSKSENKVIVIHWTAGPTTAKSLHSFFARTDRAVSSHFAIDKSGIYQYLPSSRNAYHASWINTHSIGVDICQPVVASRINDATAAGYSTRVIDNPSSRGDRKVLILDEEIVNKTAELITILSEIHGIPIVFPDSEDVIFESTQQLGNWSGVVGHHHVSSQKWDVAPWMEQIKKGISKI